jgi:hypothetical protein
MLFHLFHTIVSIEEAPTLQVETTSIFTTKLFWTLYIGNLLEEFAVY